MAEPGRFDFDDLLMSRARLAILSALLAPGEMEFTAVRDLLGLTQGNLSVHALKLLEAGYLDVRKEFVDSKPRTTYRITDRGRSALITHLKRLKSILGDLA